MLFHPLDLLFILSKITSAVHMSYETGANMTVHGDTDLTRPTLHSNAAQQLGSDYGGSSQRRQLTAQLNPHTDSEDNNDRDCDIGNDESIDSQEDIGDELKPPKVTCVEKWQLQMNQKDHAYQVIP